MVYICLVIIIMEENKLGLLVKESTPQSLQLY